MKHLLTRLAVRVVNWRLDWEVGLYNSMDGLEGSNGFVVRLAAPWRLRRWLTRFIPTHRATDRADIADILFASLWLEPESKSN
jgi:hypothetical protein